MKKLLQALKNIGRHKTQDEINAMREEFFIKAAKLKKLMSTPEWKEYTSLIEDYIQRCQLQKVKYNFALAYKLQDEKTFRNVAFLDNDIDFAQRLLQISSVFMKQVEAEEQKIKIEEEINQEANHE